jgi:hypothetical protein
MACVGEARPKIRPKIRPEIRPKIRAIGTSFPILLLPNKQVGIS